MMKSLLAMAVCVSAALVSGVASAAFVEFDSTDTNSAFFGDASGARNAWRSALGGATDLVENFDTLPELDYRAYRPALGAGFLTLSYMGVSNNDAVFFVDNIADGLQTPDFFLDFDGTSFSTAGGQGGAQTRIEFRPIRGIGFDVAPVANASISGLATVKTSLDSQFSYEVSTSAGGFVGVLYDSHADLAAEDFISLEWVNAAPNLVASGVDNVEALATPLPGAVWLLGSGLMMVAGIRRARLSQLDARR